VISTGPTVLRRLVVLGLIPLAALTSVGLATAAPRAHASGACAGTITFQLAGVRQTASQIKAGNVSCAAGKGVMRSFLQRANRQPSCRSAALRPPPTSGCVVSGYHCFLRKSVNYCAHPTSRRDVSWRQQIASARCPIASRDRPFFQQITARGVTCADAQAVVRAYIRLFPEPARHWRAAGRQWTWSRTVVSGYPLVSGTRDRSRNRLHSGRAEVILLTLPAS
jgi:hypothetical protein